MMFQAFLVQGYVVQEWHDHRLERKDHHTVILKDSSTIWTPDIYCINCRTSTLNSKDNKRVLLQVDTHGGIFYSQLYVV